MTEIADTAPGQLIRWHYLGYAVLALGVMTVAIASHDHWFLNFVHVICGGGVLWTGGATTGSLMPSAGAVLAASNVTRSSYCRPFHLSQVKLEVNRNSKRFAFPRINARKFSDHYFVNGPSSVCHSPHAWHSNVYSSAIRQIVAFFERASLAEHSPGNLGDAAT